MTLPTRWRLTAVPPSEPTHPRNKLGTEPAWKQLFRRAGLEVGAAVPPSVQEQIEDELASLVYERDTLRSALERIRDWRGFRHTGEVRDFASAVLERRV